MYVPLVIGEEHSLIEEGRIVDDLVSLLDVSALFSRLVVLICLTIWTGKIFLESGIGF